MKIRLLFLFTFLSFVAFGQETPPTPGVNFKQLSTSQFWISLPDSAIWQYKGSTYGWQQVARNSDLFKKLNLSDSVSKYVTPTQLNAKESLVNKQNSLTVDGTGVKYPTVDAVNKRTPFVTPEEFGAIGDGVSDDRDAIQDAVNSGKPVHFSNKRHFISGTVIIPTGTTIIGTGTGVGSNIYISANSAIFDIRGTDISIESMGFLGSYSSSTEVPPYISAAEDQHGILIIGGSENRERIQISNCSFYGLQGAGIFTLFNGYQDGSFGGGVQVSNSYAYLCTTGFHSAVRGEYNTFTGCKAYKCAIGFRAAAANNIFVGGILNSNRIGFFPEGGDNNGHTTISSTTINHNIDQSVFSSGLTLGYTIANCPIYDGDIYMGNSTGLRFIGCDIEVDNVFAQDSYKCEFINTKWSTTPIFNLSWNGTNNSGTPSDVKFFNNNFWSAEPISVVRNDLQGSIDIGGVIRSTKSGVMPTSGSGLQMYYDSGSAIVQSYDFVNGGTPILYYGSLHAFDNNITSPSAQIANAPVNPTDVVRLTDLGTGWAQYTDNAYTSSSPLLINSGSTSTIGNNAATSITSQLPIGVTSFYNSTTGKITPELNGDSYLINVRFTAESSSITGLCDVGIDIGGAMNIVSQETVSLRKGVGNSQRVNIVFDVFSGSTFLSNGGLIKLTSIDGNTSIYDISYKITRTHKAK